MHRRPLRYPGTWPKVPAVEKGVDVELAIDVVLRTIRRECEAVIIVSHASDLLPAVEAVVELGAAHLEVATSLTLRQPIRMPGPRSGSWVPWCHWLSADDFAAVRDWTDYTVGG